MVKKIKSYSESELIKMFGLTDIQKSTAPLMQEWLSATTKLLPHEQITFDKILLKAQNEIKGWKEESLKMNFLAFVLDLGYLDTTKTFKAYFEETLEGEVEGYFLKTKTDFMYAKGILDMPETPYFHFQEWKKQKDPNGDPTAQLLEAFLIAQERNKNGLPIYGATVVGQIWQFYIMEGKTYHVSKIYDCTEKEDLMQIVAMLRKFKEILENRLSMP